MSPRPIPMDVDAECAVVGAMILSASAQPGTLHWDISELRAVVGPEAFADADCRTLFATLIEADDAGDPIDAVGILPRLNAKGTPSCGGEWLTVVLEIAEQVPSTAYAPFYARAVRKAWQLREIIRITNRADNDAREPRADPSDIIGTLCDALESIDEASARDREARTESELIRKLENPANRDDVRVPVTIGELGPRLGGGLDFGTMTIVGARPSCGKTSLGLGLCVHAARATGGCASLFVSAEMSAEQVAHRLLSMRSGVPLSRIRSGDVLDDEFTRERNRAAIDADGGEPIYILDGVRDARAIAAYVRRCVRRHGVRLVVVDYLGLLNMPGDYERHDLRIGAASAMFKGLAADTRTAVVVLEQLNRASAREARKPVMSDLRDSGKIEADADTIILIHREPDKPGPVSDTTLIVAKQRQGETGEAMVSYHRPTMSYQAKTWDAIAGAGQG